jgi:hypothetical protein
MPVAAPASAPAAPTIALSSAVKSQGAAPAPTAKAQVAVAGQAPTARAAVAINPALPPDGIEGLVPRLSVPLRVSLIEVTGLAATPGSLYVASFDSQKRLSMIYRLRPDTGALIQMRHVVPGMAGRVGGIHMGERYLWLPLSDDSRPNITRILGLDPQYLEVKQGFEVPYQISAVAQGLDGSLYGLGQDGSLFYVWNAEGRELRRVPNSSGASYGDMEVIQGSVVCAGVDQVTNSGVLDVLDPQGFTILARHRSQARTANQQWLTARGFAFVANTFYFLPEAGETPFLASYGLATGNTLEQYVPGVKR